MAKSASIGPGTEVRGLRAEPVAGDALDGLDRYLDLSHDAAGLLVYGGDEARSRGRHHLRPWWALS